MFRLALAVIAICNAPVFSSASPLRNNLLRVARNLEDKDADYSWLVNHSLRFESCHTKSEYALNDGQGSVYMQKLVEFNMCTTKECNSSCKGGRYLVQMEDFVEAYAEQKEADKEYACEQMKENCYCENDDDNCEYNCYIDSGLDYCIEDENKDEAINMKDYVECQEYAMQEGGDENDAEQVYIGLKCSEDGKGINLGIFTDEYCTVEKVDNTQTFSYPYQSESFVTNDCINCAYTEDNGDGDDAAAVEYGVSAMCENNYLEAVKCEQDLTGLYYPNNDGCDIIKNMSLTGTTYERHYKAAVAAAIVFAISTLILAVIALRLCCISKRKIHLNDGDEHASKRGNGKYNDSKYNESKYNESKYNESKDPNAVRSPRRSVFPSFNCFKSSV